MPPQPLEVNLLAIKAPESEVERCAVALLIGVVAPSTLSTWCRAYQEGGVSGLSRQASSIAVRRQWVCIYAILPGTIQEYVRRVHISFFQE